MSDVRKMIAGMLLLCGLVVQAALANGTAEAGTPESAARARVIVVVGAGGEEEFGDAFEKWAELWSSAAGRGGANCSVVGLTETNTVTDLARLQEVIAAEPTNSLAELWLVLIGHGTFDGRDAKFNLRGPDFSVKDLAGWLAPFRRPVVVINCSSSSSPFIKELSGPNRVVVTASRSGYEQNYARFGRYIAESIVHARADLDKDGQTSVLEAFIMASRSTLEFYDAEGRLATEHALLDDNGDGLGTPADFFRGVRAVKQPSGGGSVDGLRAHQLHLVLSEEEMRMSPEMRTRRNDLEMAVAGLRDKKGEFSENEYYERLERLLLQLAELYAGQAQVDTEEPTSAQAPQGEAR